MNTAEILFIVGTIGNVTSFILYLSPLPTILYIWKKRSSEKFSPMAYICGLLACLMWTYYGSPWVKNALLITTINGLGSFFQLIFIAVFSLFAIDRQTRIRTLRLLVLHVAAFGILVLCTMEFVSDKTRRILIVGCIAVTTSIIMFASPLVVTKQVIKEKNTKYLPINFTIGALLNAAVWVLYGVISKDMFVILPNALGTALSLFQVVLHTIFRKPPVPSKSDKEFHDFDESKVVDVPRKAAVMTTGVNTTIHLPAQGGKEDAVKHVVSVGSPLPTSKQL